ncbi:DEAD/DEAH box helicase [Weissella cibaria]|nr:DEAD/DEAH box helicase [Weissella cibaria]MDH5013106.1 DEAD/DEAH box helicase [Weissella cibaria]
MKMSSNVKLIKTEHGYALVDNLSNVLTERKVARVLSLYKGYFSDTDAFDIRDVNYVELTDLINDLKRVLAKFAVELEISSDVEEEIDKETYLINEQRQAGLMIKNFDPRWKDDIAEFQRIVNEEVIRPLLPQQVQSSFYLMKMKRAANFSVPGAGKTAMTYGTYAYLSSNQIAEVDRLLVISPINAFEAWRSEYEEIFGNKRQLRYLNIKDTDPQDLALAYSKSNVAVLNYESLNVERLNILNRLIDVKTMIVFDEVHRIKNPSGQRARMAMELGKTARYHYVLTGTPIPNSYQDVYNMLNILYGSEYDSHFGFELNELNESNADEINDKINPFFWRTTKQDLNVPPAEPDIIESVQPNSDQKLLAETIYEVETNVLAKYIRLMQASTNPELLTKDINWDEMGLLLGVDYTSKEALDNQESKLAAKQAYMDLEVDKMVSSKFEYGISLIQKLVSEGKPVVVWGMFVGTMTKILNRLNTVGIKAHLIYGATPKNQRVGMINQFKRGEVQVLISNPATLGESISLHKTAHDAVYFEYNFNLTFMLQSRDRIHRLGLKDDDYTRYYYLMTAGDKAHLSYIDRAVYQRLKEKEQVMMSAIEGETIKPMIDDDYFDEIKKLLS